MQIIELFQIVRFIGLHKIIQFNEHFFCLFCLICFGCVNFLKTQILLHMKAQIPELSMGLFDKQYIELYRYALLY